MENGQKLAKPQCKHGSLPSPGTTGQVLPSVWGCTAHSCCPRPNFACCTGNSSLQLSHIHFAKLPYIALTEPKWWTPNWLSVCRYIRGCNKTLPANFASELLTPKQETKSLLTCVLSHIVNSPWDLWPNSIQGKYYTIFLHNRLEALAC